MLVMAFSGVTQNPRFEYKGRTNPSVKKESLKGAKYLTNIDPDLWKNLYLSYEERNQLNKVIGPLNYTVFSPGNYSNVIELVSVSITAICNGKEMSAISTDDVLSLQQKSILSSADLGSDITLKVNFKFKNKYAVVPEMRDKVLEGQLPVTVIPELEAEFQGGTKKFSAYFNDSVISKIRPTTSARKIFNAVMKFTIDEKGHIQDAKLIETTTDSGIDQLLLEAIRKMPEWKPAENPRGIKVKQEFTIPFGGGC